MNTAETFSFTKDELNLITESLLFSSSVNICADWDENSITSMLELAKKIKKHTKTDTDLKNIYFLEEENYEEKWTGDIIKNFKGKIRVLDLSKA
jgi:hypothetical protein